MSLKKKVLTTLSLVLILGLAALGILAYLMDDDSDVNVMTLGNVKIEQIEQEWNAGKTELVDFTQAKPLYPYVGNLGWEFPVQDNAYRTFTMNNVVDKYVSVKNTGKSDAYVRTFIALEMGEYSYDEFNKVGISINKEDGDEFDFPGTWQWTDDFVASIDGKNYNIMVAVHKDPLKPGETTIPSLLQVYLSKDATNETVEKLDGNGNGTYDILVFSQAVQAEGFADAKTALNTAFGDTSDPTRYHPWVDGVEIPALVSDADELQAAINAAANGDTIVLGADIEGDVTVTQKPGVKFTINGNGNTIDGSIIVDGKSARYETAGVTIENVKFAAETLIADAFINLGDGNTNTRYTNNVTVSNCTFDYSGTEDKVAIKSYTGGDWNLTVDGCTAKAGMHSLVQVTNVEKGLTITNCKAYSKNGINLNNTPYLNMSGCEFDTVGYCVRFGVNGATNNGNFTIADSTLESANDDDDAVIILRGTMTGATLNIEGTTLIGDPDITGNANIIE